MAFCRFSLCMPARELHAKASTTLPSDTRSACYKNNTKINFNHTFSAFEVKQNDSTKIKEFHMKLIKYLVLWHKGKMIGLTVVKC